MSDVVKFDLTPVFDELEILAKKSNRVNEGDYINEKDGLLYCGKCRTPKQSEIEFLGKIRRPFCMCECEAEKEEKKRKQAELAERVERYQREAFDDAKMLNWNFENDDGKNPALTEALKRYVANFPRFVKEGKGLLLHGDVGTGKSFAAVSVANELIKQGYPCKATNFSTIINDISATFDKKQRYLNDLKSYALLIIDDLGIERNSEFAKEIVWNVIDSRYRSELPLIVTTNLSIEQIKKPENTEDKRIYSRILEMCHPICVEGRDRRKMKVKDEYTEMKDLLGL